MRYLPSVRSRFLDFDRKKRSLISSHFDPTSLVNKGIMISQKDFALIKIKNDLLREPEKKANFIYSTINTRESFMFPFFDFFLLVLATSSPIFSKSYELYKLTDSFFLRGIKADNPEGLR